MNIGPKDAWGNPVTPPSSTDAAKDATIQALREEVDTLKAELERARESGQTLYRSMRRWLNAPPAYPGDAMAIEMLTQLARGAGVDVEAAIRPAGTGREA